MYYRSGSKCIEVTQIHKYATKTFFFLFHTFQGSSSTFVPSSTRGSPVTCSSSGGSRHLHREQRRLQRRRRRQREERRQIRTRKVGTIHSTCPGCRKKAQGFGPFCTTRIDLSVEVLFCRPTMQYTSHSFLHYSFPFSAHHICIAGGGGVGGGVEDQIIDPGLAKSSSSTSAASEVVTAASSAASASFSWSPNGDVSMGSAEGRFNVPTFDYQGKCVNCERGVGVIWQGIANPFCTPYSHFVAVVVYNKTLSLSSLSSLLSLRIIQVSEVPVSRIKRLPLVSEKKGSSVSPLSPLSLLSLLL